MGGGCSRKIVLIVGKERGAQLDTARVVVAQVIHKRRMIGGVGKKRKVVHAVVQRAYRTGVQWAAYGDNRGAVDIDGAQIACELVGNQLNTVAVKAALLVLRQRK